MLPTINHYCVLCNSRVEKKSGKKKIPVVPIMEKMIQKVVIKIKV